MNKVPYVEHHPRCDVNLNSDNRYPCTCKDFEVPEFSSPKGSNIGSAQVGTAEYSGGSSDYYKVDIRNTTTPYSLPYTAECNDIIEALGMNFAEGNAFKALWRRAAQRTLGKRKAGAKDDGLYDAQKVEFFGARLVEQSKAVRDAQTE